MIGKRIIMLFVGFLTIFMLLNCKKTDYRDNFTGMFEFTVNKSIHNFIDSTNSDTTVYYSGQIINGSSSNDIFITYLPNWCVQAILGESGYILKPPTSGQGWGFSGRFETYKGTSKNSKFDLCSVAPLGIVI